MKPTDQYLPDDEEQEAGAMGMEIEESGAHEVDEEQRRALFASLCQSIIARRKEAIDHRASSGIEQEWIEDDEFYSGIDDGNRHEFAQGATKPLAGGSAPLKRDRPYGSTVVPNITGPYVDAASARIGDMLLPTDDRNFALDPTPIPDLGEVVRGILSGTDAPATAEALPMPDGSTASLPDLDAKLKQTKAEAQRKADRAQTRIDDWMIECDYHGELRTVIDDCARVGSGVIKGPFPVLRKSKRWDTGPDGQTVPSIKEEYMPASKRISYWDFFPDKDCGMVLHDGDYVFERDRLSATKLRTLKGQDGYLSDQIDLVIEQGPAKHTQSGRLDRKDDSNRDLFEVWYYYGIIKREELESAGCECEDDAPEVYAILTLVNDLIIRASINPHSDGDFPYDIIPWKKRQGMVWGVGVAREIRTSQRMVTAATRNLMNNAGLSGGPQIVYRKMGLRPRDGKWEIRPNKFWEADEETDVGKAFQAVVFPMLVAELERIIMMGMKFAEDVTGMPTLLQGQQGKAPDTVGGLTILNNNANAVLRRIARLFDSYITEPHVRRYYDWLMEYGDNPDEKGDCRINARGSSALVERDIQTQEMVQILQMSANPVFGKNPKKAMDEYLKSRRFDPGAFDFTEEELAEMAQQQPAPPPQIQAAQIRAESAMQVAQLRAEVDKFTDANDVDRDRIYSEAEMARVANEHQARMAELSVKRELAMLDYANKNQLKLNDVKSQLAQTAAKIKSTEKLAALGAAANMMPKPPVEPPGRAPAGKSFQR